MKPVECASLMMSCSSVKYITMLLQSANIPNFGSKNIFKERGEIFQENMHPCLT